MYLFLCYVLFLGFVSANVEKIIFKGPDSIKIPLEHPNLDDLRLTKITPLHWSLRTQLSAAFPDNDNKKGKESWYLLDGLRHGQRYEVRICWLATQPTSFSLYTHTLPKVFETPSLITSLSTFSESLPIPTQSQPSSQQTPLHPSHSSLLFLQVFAAADYYTMNQTLMKNVPPVDVDIILDPYVLNVFPRSLVPTAGYIALLAVVSWFIAGWVWKWLRRIAISEAAEKDQATEAGHGKKGS